MNLLGRLCREVYRDMNQSRRSLAHRLGIPLGRCHRVIANAIERELVTVLPGALGLTLKGKEYLESFRVQNAVILAAGMDVRFVPFTHEIPKCMMQVEGERLIERLCRQLHERGITDITIVVGYLAEKFEYLKDTFGVKLLYNEEYATKNNLASLYHARHLLGQSYLIAADQWLWENIFDEYEPEAWCACQWCEGATGKWCIHTDGKGGLCLVNEGGRDKLAMLGPVHLDKGFSQALRAQLEEEYHRPDNDDARWESALNPILAKNPIYANILPQRWVEEFSSFEDLRDLEPAYARSSGNENIRTIATIFDVAEREITGFTWLDVGMNNQSFFFGLGGEQYIYRIPGEGTENFISRRQEADVYDAIRSLGIADEVLYFNRDSGIKVAKYYPNSHNVRDDDWDEVKACMQMLRQLHKAELKVEHSFDILRKVDEYEEMCRKVDCIHFDDFEKIKQKVQAALDIIRDTKEPKILCHCDSANVNFLVKEDGSLCLLDWEYSGMCHGVADVAMYGVFSSYSFEQIHQLLEWYYGRTPSRDEWLLCLGYATASGFLWSMWASFREYYGEDFGEYTQLQYNIAKDGSRLLGQLLDR